MKKNLSLIAALMAVLLIFSSCGSAPAQQPGDSGLKIVTTIFPEYDWVSQILGDKAGDAELTLLLDNGADLHSYQPTAQDILKISSCDLFIYVGGESDEWVDDALKEAVNSDMIVLNLLDILGDAVVEEEIVEGMEHEHGEGEDHEHEEPEYDEHVWLSLRNAAKCCAAIEEALAKLDPASADSYAANLSAYTEKLNALDAAYAEAVSAAHEGTLIFGDRFPFRYLAEDYGLDYYAAFSGCSAETEASFETVVFLAKKLDELGLSCVMNIDGSDGKIAETVIRSSGNQNRKILTLDSMQSSGFAEFKAGSTYFSIMESNLEVLKEALQ